MTILGLQQSYYYCHCYYYYFFELYLYLGHQSLSYSSLPGFVNRVLTILILCHRHHHIHHRQNDQIDLHQYHAEVLFFEMSYTHPPPLFSVRSSVHDGVICVHQPDRLAHWQLPRHSY